MVEGKAVVGDACVDCGACVDACPVAAISME
jgi:ferredoxin